jgi:hypothetical protein
LPKWTIPPRSIAAVLITAVQLVAGSVPCFGAPILRAPDNSGDIEFKATLDLHQDTTKPSLGNGVVVDTNKWPASLYGTYGANEICSATLIGPRVILTAAHCVGDGHKASVTRLVGVGGTGTCTHATIYKTDDSADYALCLMINDIVAVPYETLSTDAKRLKAGLQLIGTGYGCTDISNLQLVPDQQTHHLDFRIGPLWIDTLPSAGSAQGNYISTRSDPNSAFVCPGDSGSAAFISGGVDRNGNSRRGIVAINVQVHTDTLISDLSSTSTPTALAFFKSWLSDNSAQHPTICGINAPQASCRQLPP